MTQVAKTFDVDDVAGEAEQKPVRVRPGFWTRFKRRRLAVLAAGVLVVMMVVAIVVWLASLFGVYIPFNPNDMSLDTRLLPPSWPHVLGTDQFGRDVLARVLSGSYISMFIGFLAVGISMTLGLLVGATAGYFRGAVDNVLMRFVDALLCIPSFLLVLTIVAMFESTSIFVLIAAIGVLSWMGTARLVRAEFLTLRETDYVAAARALGVPTRRIIFRHILPNALAPVFVSAVLGVAGAILTEAGLSFLGFGVKQPQASWGNIIADGKAYLLDAWWLIIFPGLAILVTTLAFYLTGEGIREVLDPRESKRI